MIPLSTSDVLWTLAVNRHIGVSLAVITQRPERQGQRYVKNKRPTNRGRGPGTQIEFVYHPNHVGDEPSAQTRLVPVPCEVRAESDSTNAPTTPPPPSSKSNKHNLRRRATMTPPAKGRPRQPEPREVRADGQAGALPPHKTINGRRQSSNRNNAHNNSHLPTYTITYDKG